MVEIMNSLEILGEFAPQPCDEAHASAFAQAALAPGTTLSLFPYNPAPLQPDELRIEVTHSGMCHSDVFMTTLGWGDNVMFPLVPGHEIAGVVTAMGDQVKGFDLGERVSFGVFRTACKKGTCEFCASGRENLCPQREETYCPYFGGYSTSFQGRADFFTHIPAGILSEHAAPLMCAGLTTFAPLNAYTRPGMKVGVQGLGGLGHLGVQFAAHMGCEVTAVSTSASKAQLACELGAQHFLNTSIEAEKRKARNALDLLLITSSAYKISDYLDLVKPGGSVCVVGLPDAKADLGVTMDFIITGKKLIGSIVGSLGETRDMFNFCELHHIQPKVEIHAFDQAQQAYDMLALSQPRAPVFRNVLETHSFLSTHRH